MLRLAADENFNGDIVRGLVRRKPIWTLFAFKTWAFPGQMTQRDWNGQPSKGGCC